jgi:hypothetical protein
MAGWGNDVARGSFGVVGGLGSKGLGVGGGGWGGSVGGVTGGGAGAGGGGLHAVPALYFESEFRLDNLATFERTGAATGAN